MLISWISLFLAGIYSSIICKSPTGNHPGNTTEAASLSVSCKMRHCQLPPNRSSLSQPLPFPVSWTAPRVRRKWTCWEVGILGLPKIP